MNSGRTNFVATTRPTRAVMMKKVTALIRKMAADGSSRQDRWTAVLITFSSPVPQGP